MSDVITEKRLTQKQVHLGLKQLKVLLRKNPEKVEDFLTQNPLLNKRLEELLSQQTNWSKSKLLKTIQLVDRTIEETSVMVVHCTKGGIGKSLFALLLLQLAILEAAMFPNKTINFAIATADLNQGLRMILDEIFRECALLPKNLRISLITEQYDDYKPKSSVVINNNLNRVILDNREVEIYAQNNNIEVHSTDIGEVYCITDSDGKLIKLDYLVYDLAAGVNDVKCKTATNHYVVASVQDSVSIENALDLLEIKLREVYNSVKDYIVKHDLIEPTHENILMVMNTVKEASANRSNLSVDEKQMIKETGAAVKLTFVHNNKMGKGSKEEFKDVVEPELKRLMELYQTEIEYIYIPNFNFPLYQDNGIPFVLPAQDLTEAKRLRGEVKKSQAIEHRVDFQEAFQNIYNTYAA